MVVAQDGCELEDFKQIIEVLNLDDVCGIFIGGSTDWKLNNIAKIAQICRSMDKLCHVGRVNSASRLRFAFDCGATSIDGSGASRFKPTTKIICKQLNEIKATENQLPLFDFL